MKEERRAVSMGGRDWRRKQVGKDRRWREERSEGGEGEKGTSARRRADEEFLQEIKWY